MTQQAYLTQAVIFLAIGGVISLVTALVIVRGVIGSKSVPSEPYRRDKDPASFWIMATAIGGVAALFIIKGAINLYKFLEVSN